MTPCTCHPGKTCASAASCAAARKTEFGEAVSTEKRLREALQYAIKQVPELATVPGIAAALSLPATEQASAEPLKPMIFDDGRKGWFVDHPEFYIDIEPDETGKWSCFFRHKPSGKEAFAERRKAWSDAANWLRNNYQDHQNIASLCDAMREEGSKGQR